MKIQKEYQIKGKNRKIIAEVFSYLDHSIENKNKEEFVDSILREVPSNKEIGHAGYRSKKSLKKFLLWSVFGHKQITKWNNIKKEELKEQIEKTLIKFKPFLKDKIYIFIFPTVDDFIIKEMNGVTGFCPWKNTILISMNPISGWKTALRGVIGHELAHAISPYYWKNTTIGPTEDELNLLGEKKDKKIIEIGAGGCQKAIYLAKQGSIMTAFDISKKQLEIGKKFAREEKASLDFIAGDFQMIDSYFPESTFDSAYSIFALQYNRNRDNLKRTFKGIHTILKENGIFVLSLDHPFGRGYWNEDNKFILDNYFDRSEKEWDYEFPEENTSGHFRGSFWTLSDMTNALIDSGFNLKKILEPEPIKREKYFDQFGKISRYGINNKKDPFYFGNLSRVPSTIIIKGVKEK